MIIATLPTRDIENMGERMSSLWGRAAGNTAENKAAVPRTEQTELNSANAAFAELQRTARALNLTVPSAALCEELRHAVERAATRDAESMENLRLRVADFTIALREVGTTPEAVLITLKALINAGTLPPTARNHPDWSGYMLREKMSTWSIEAYFKEPEQRVIWHHDKLEL